jgi:FtsP/CotA-like multicopper oxidase with cupredoxin domain
MTVPVGSVITWTNQTDAPHTVTADGGAFNSPRLNQNQTFSFTFNTPGTFAFHCAVHPYMTGTVVVNAANSAPASAAAAASASSPASPVASRVASAATTSSTGAAVPSAAPKTGAGGGASSSMGIPMGFTAGVLILLVAGSGGALAFAIRRSPR